MANFWGFPNSLPTKVIIRAAVQKDQVWHRRSAHFLHQQAELLHRDVHASVSVHRIFLHQFLSFAHTLLISFVLSPLTPLDKSKWKWEESQFSKWGSSAETCDVICLKNFAFFLIPVWADLIPASWTMCWFFFSLNFATQLLASKHNMHFKCAFEIK